MKKTIQNIFANKQYYVVLVLSLLIFNGKQLSAQCTTADQSQLNYNGGMSARNLALYTVWQSFTPGVTGTLCKLDVGFFNPMTGTGTLNIYSGTGTLGSLLQTQSVMVSGTGNFFQTFTISVAVVAGSVYTFQFIPTQGGGLPDPYGVQIENPGTYAGGQMETSDPSGTYTTGFDMVFNTYVSITTNVASLQQNRNSFEIFPNPFSNQTLLRTTVTLTNATLSIYTILGQEIKTIKNISGKEIILNRSGLPEGIYFIVLTENNTFIAKDKIIISN